MPKSKMQLIGNPPQFPEVPDGRVYIHSRCSVGTRISGFDFTRLCTPGGRTPTICANCRRAFPLDEFVWEDTGETVTVYLDRLKSLLPQAYIEGQRKWAWAAGIGSTLGAIGGTTIGYVLAKSGAGVLGGLFGGLLVGVIVGGLTGSALFVPNIEFRKYI